MIKIICTCSCWCGFFFLLWIHSLNGQAYFLENPSPPQTVKLLQPTFSPGRMTPSDSLRLDWRREYFSQNATHRDVAYAVTTDKNAFLYVAGMTTQVPNGVDFLIIKYDTAGNQIWTATHNGPGNHDDIAQFIGLDAYGNIYVAGKSMGENSNFDMLLLKYNPAGEKIWAARYDGPAGGKDLISAMAVAHDGCVYLTGCRAADARNDFTTLKFNSDGTLAWAYSFESATNALHDYGRDLVIDAAGNVYVTGDNSAPAIITMMLTADGAVEWSQSITGFKHLKAAAIAIDSSGNVIVAGYGDQEDYNPDFLTVKYTSSGAEQWITWHGGAYGDIPADVAVDRAGNIYLIGTDSDSVYHSDYIALKYNADGVLQWTDRFDVATTDYITPISISLDETGMVYICATLKNQYYLPGFVAVKLDSAGTRQWTATDEQLDWAFAAQVDRDGNFYVVGRGDSYYGWSFATLRFNSDGELDWKKEFSGQNGTIASAKKIVPDATGHVFVAVENLGQMTLIKNDPTGNPVWQVETDSLQYWRELREIRLADDGSVYLAGSVGNDLGLMKISSAGAVLWTATVKSNDFLIDLEVDRNYVIMTGTTSGNYSKTITVKYNSSGQKEWSQIYNSASRNYEIPCDLAVDYFGNSYVAGYSWNDAVNHSSRSAYLIKYTHTGEVAWIKSNETEFAWMTPSGVAVDQIGNIILNLQNNRGITTIKFDPSGKEIWQVHNPLQWGHLYPMTQNIRIDEMNFIYIFLDNGGILKYHPEGQPEWLVESGIGRFSARRGGLALDAESNAYVYIEDSDLPNPHYFLKYDRAGTVQWVSFCDYTINDLAVDPAGRIFTAGVREGSGWSSGIAEKYTSVSPRRPAFPTDYQFFQNFPNPFNFGTRFHYEMPVAGHATLKIYNVLGQYVVTVVDEFQKPGIYTVPFFQQNLSNGIYFGVFRVNDFTAQKKIMLVK